MADHGWMEVAESQMFHLHWYLSLLTRLSITSWRQLLLHHFELRLHSLFLESHSDRSEHDMDNIFYGL